MMGMAFSFLYSNVVSFPAHLEDHLKMDMKKMQHLSVKNLGVLLPYGTILHQYLHISIHHINLFFFPMQNYNSQKLRWTIKKTKKSCNFLDCPGLKTWRRFFVYLLKKKKKAWVDLWLSLILSRADMYWDSTKNESFNGHWCCGPPYRLLYFMAIPYHSNLGLQSSLQSGPTYLFNGQYGLAHLILYINSNRRNLGLQLAVRAHLFVVPLMGC